MEELIGSTNANRLKVRTTVEVIQAANSLFKGTKPAPVDVEIALNEAFRKSMKSKPTRPHRK